MKMRFAIAALSALLATALFACEGKTPQSDSAKQAGGVPKQTVDKIVTEANKAIEQGEARARESIDGNK